MLNKKFKHDPIKVTEIKVDNRSHIDIKNVKDCQECSDKPCTYVCPSQVYQWEEKVQKTIYDYSRCVECGACILICPRSNIDWDYPRSGWGVVFKY